jgi:FAD synthase
MVFRQGARGNLALLKRLGASHAFSVVGVKAVTVNGEVVSSTAIRVRSRPEI